MLGWAGALFLAALAFFLRRWHLGTPHAFSFDETYYAKDAWSLLNHGYVRRLRRGRRQDDPQRQRHRAVAGRPVDDRPPRGRQVGDRRRHQGLRDGPHRLAHGVGGGGRADGPADVPLRPARHRLDRPRAGGRPPALRRRPPARAVAARTARHLPGVLHPLRRALRGRRPSVAARPAGRRRDTDVVATLAGPRRDQLRARVRHEVVRGLRAGRLRPARVAVERRRAAGVRPAPAAAPLDRPRRGAGVRRAGGRRAGDLRRVVDGLAGARRRLRGRVQQHAVHVVRRREAVADRERAGRRRPRGGDPVAAVAVVVPPGRLHLPQPLPQRLDARLRLQAVDLAGHGSSGRASTPRPTSSPARRGARRPRARAASGRSCSSATR